MAGIAASTSGPIAEKAAQSLAAGIKSVMGTEELQVAEPEEVKQEYGGKEFSFTIHKCSDKSGKSSIIGKTPKDGDLLVSKDDKSVNAVDAITASTITSRAFLKAINQAYAVYAKKDVDGESGASQNADAEFCVS